jgi:hypothetical protein
LDHEEDDIATSVKSHAGSDLNVMFEPYGPCS